MIRRLLPLLALASLACHTATTPAPAPAPTPIATVPSSASGPVDQARAILAARGTTLPGVSVAVAVDGKIVWAEGAGHANIEAGTPMTATTPLRVYSTAKSIAATLAMQLAESGKLELDAPISRYVDGLPANVGAITTRQLLSQNSGVRNYRRGEWLGFAARKCSSPIDALPAFVNDPLESQPGEKWGYTTYNYVLASAVIARAGGAPFETLLRDRVLTPAGMTNTERDDPAAERRTGGGFYEKNPSGGFKPAPAGIDNTCKYGAGGLLSTAHDLASFGAALLDNKIVSAAGVEQLFKPANKEGDYGLGFVITKDDELGTLVAHSGASPGGMAYLLIVPEKRVVVALATNIEAERFTKDARAIARAFSASKQ